MKIKTIELLPLETRILLKEEMRREIFSDKKQIASLLNVSVGTVDSWRKGKTKPTKSTLMKLGIDLNSDEFLNNIISEGTKKTQFNLPNNIDLTEFAWLLGIVEGDRAGNKNESIGLSNNNKDLIKKFISNIENLNIKRESLIINVNINKDMDISKQKISLEFGIPINRIFITVTRAPLKKPLFQVFLFNRAIANMFKTMLSIFQSSGDIKDLTEFIQGFSDAEGSVSVKRKTIELKQKNCEEGRRRVFLVSKSLDLLGVENSIEGPNCENMLIIRILGGKKNSKNLLRFNRLIGFSSLEKEIKLTQILNDLS